MATPFPPHQPNPMIPGFVTILRTDAIRTRDVVKEVEQAQKFYAPSARRESQAEGPWLMQGYATNGATSSNGATLGVGSFHPCTVNSTTHVRTPINGTTYTFTNAGGAVNGPAFGLFGWANGEWTAVVFPCN